MGKIFTRHLRLSLLGVLLTPVLCWSQPTEIQLPNLGNSDISLVSIAEEERLGQDWLRSFYGRTPLMRDYLMQSYIESLVYRLVPYSDIPYDDVQVVVINSPTLNAFAVPGGIIGVNNGIFLYADNEDQLASILAHELAHLSQRHFARSVANQQSSGITTMAGLLASVVLAATVGSDAGIAMAAATQGAAANSQLRYSRQNEQEADRIGQATLYRAGLDPAATSVMFEHMNDLTRMVGSRIPEYLLTHPLPESRLNDTAARAAQYPERFYPVNLTYQMLRARIQTQQAARPEDALLTFSGRLEIEPNNIAAGYGYTLALQRAGRLEEAYQRVSDLRQREPNQTPIIVTQAEILIDQKKYSEAVSLLQDALRSRPNDHALTMELSFALNRANRHEEAARLLSTHSRARPGDPVIWYDLAETRGLAGDILGVHMARAEYFLIVGQFNRAIQHFRYAIEQIGDDEPIERAVLQERINQTQKMRENVAF